MVLSELIEIGPCVSSEHVPLTGLQMMAEEIALRSDSDSSPDLGDMWKCGCPKKPCVWNSNGVEWAGSEGTSSYEHNVGNLALEVFGQIWSSEVISLFLERFGRSGEVALMLPRVNGPSLPRNEGCVWGEPRVAAFFSFTVFRVPGRNEEVS